MLDGDTEDLSKIRSSEISYSSNFYKTKVFCIQRSDQEIELNEAFGFRLEIDLSPHELVIQHEDYHDTSFNYRNQPFYVEVGLQWLKWKFWNLSFKQVSEHFRRGTMRQIQTMTLALKTPIKGLSEFMLINYKGDYLSQCYGTVHSLLVNFKEK